MAASGSIDWDALLAKLGGDAGVLRELLEVVIATHRTVAEDLRAASRQQDFAAIERLAHRTKGTAISWRPSVSRSAAPLNSPRAITNRLPGTSCSSSQTRSKYCCATCVHTSAARRDEARDGAVAASNPGYFVWFCWQPGGPGRIIARQQGKSDA